MQDGAPAHRTRVVKELLHDHFEDRVIALGWDPEWSPRSPDLTPCDFHLWGTLKDKVYARRYGTISELKAGIWSELERYDLTMIKDACLSVRTRLEDVITNGGRHVQHMRGR